MMSGNGHSRALASMSADFDPLGDLPASTVAMIIFFGSLTFATVSMMTRMLLSGDKRAILIATSIKVKSPFPNSTDGTTRNRTEPQIERASHHTDDVTDVKDSVESVISNDSHGLTVGTREKSLRSKHSHSVTTSRSVAFARNVTSVADGNTVANIRAKETAFVQTFVLMYHMMLFGLMILGIYFVDKYPPNGRPSSAPSHGTVVLNEPFQFNADKFISWLVMLVVYSSYTCWQCNDGKSCESKVQPATTESGKEQHNETVESSLKKNESPLRQRQQKNKLVSRRDETSTVSRGSSHSGFSKRLEDIMLEEVLGHDDHDTIDDAFENAKREDKSWLERILRSLGFDLHEANQEGTFRQCSPACDLLNPIQTLEWKGLLSIALLVYQYCSDGRSGTYMAKVDPDDEQFETSEMLSPIWRNMEMIAVSSFLFLTGYNQTSYYYFHPDSQKTKSDQVPLCYGFARVLTIMFRWNWVAIFLSLALGNNFFEQYSVCLIHTCFFVAIWLMLRLHHSINYTKYKFRFKVLAFGCLIVILDMMLTKLLRRDSVKSVLWEWRYLSHLHHLAPFAGVIFAINKPISSLQLRKLESYSAITATLAKGSICLALTAATTAWAAGPLQQYSYDRTHAYFCVAPLLTFIYWRNLNQSFRSHHNHFLSWIGQYSLEIFIVSKHTMRHEGFFTVLLGYPDLNFLLVSMGIVFVSKSLYHVTNVLRQILIPGNGEHNSGVQVSSFATGIIPVMYIFAKLLCWTDMVSVGSITTIVIIIGVLLYQVIMDMFWSEHQSQLTNNQPSSDATQSSITKISVPISGIMSIFLIGATCYGWASYSAATNTIDESCIDDVNNGYWLPINACNARNSLKDGINYFGYADCEDFVVGHEWIWPKEYMYCGFRYRSSNDIKLSLLHKRVTFIGDSSVRSLFYSLCRSMGDFNAGYEGINQHADLRRLFPSANIEYQFSPLTVDIVSKLKSIRTISGKPKPDLLLAGGGAWDKLHLAATDEDQQSFREIVGRLAFELNKLREEGISVVWLVPPAINTMALNSDEKRAQMGEDILNTTRQMYEELGVLGSAHFVLDGPSFTKDRIADAADGIDFPPEVYDAGTQILANVFDWILEPHSDDEPEGLTPDVDISANHYLKAQVLVFALIGLFFFDAYFGISYLAQLFVSNDRVSPSDLVNQYDAESHAQNNEQIPSHDNVVNELLGRPLERSSGRSVHSTTSLSRRR